MGLSNNSTAHWTKKTKKGFDFSKTLVQNELCSINDSGELTTSFCEEEGPKQFNL